MTDRFAKKPRVYYPRVSVQLTLVVEGFQNDKERDKDLKTIVFNPRPLNLSIVRNSYNQADSFSMTFDAKDMPIAPSVIRTGNTQILIYDSSNDPGDPSRPTQDDKKDIFTNSDRLAFSGVIDDVEMNFSGSGRTVTLQGQDFTALFIEKRYWDSQPKDRDKRRRRRRALNNSRLDTFVQSIIEDAAKGAPLSFANETGFRTRELPKVGKGSTKTNKRGFPVRRDSSFWDVLYETSARLGFIIFVRGNQVVLARPLKVQKGVKRPLYSLTWGNNIESINLSRKMGRQKTPRVRCVSYNDKTKRTISATYPKNRKQVAATGVGTLYNEIVVKRVDGVRDSDELLKVAENWYNVLARSEQVAKIATRDMEDDAGRDLLKLSSGDLMQVNFKPFNKEDLDKMDETEKTSFLIKRGLPARAASIIASQTELLSQFKQDLYVRTADLSWDVGSGFSMNVEVVNVVNINKTEDKPDQSEE